jgi:transposase
MKRFIEGAARDQVALLPECLEDYVDADNAVRVVDVFVDELDLIGLGFERAGFERASADWHIIHRPCSSFTSMGT